MVSILRIGRYLRMVALKRRCSLVGCRSILEILSSQFYNRWILNWCRWLVLSWIHIGGREVDCRPSINIVRSKSRWRRILSPLHFHSHLCNLLHQLHNQLILFCNGGLGHHNISKTHFFIIVPHNCLSSV